MVVSLQWGCERKDKHLRVRREQEDIYDFNDLVKWGEILNYITVRKSRGDMRIISVCCDYH